MIINKKKYFLIIENTRDIELKNIKLHNKFVIIYRNKKKIVDINALIKFRMRCLAKKIDFYVSNDVKLMKTIKADGLYISAYNRKLRLANFKKANFKIIGSAHNIKEINIKNLQKCSHIIFSRLFQTHYKKKAGYLGLIKFNLLKMQRSENLVPLGGINLINLNKLNLVKSNFFGLMSEVKKKPAKIFSRLF